MKKKVVCAGVLFCLLFSFSASAAEIPFDMESFDTAAITGNQHVVDAGQLNPGGVLRLLNFKTLFEMFFDSAGKQLTGSLSGFGVLSALLLLGAFLKNLSSSFPQAEQICQWGTRLSLAWGYMLFFDGAMELIAGTVEEITLYISTAFPVLATSAAVAGLPSTAAASQTALLAEVGVMTLFTKQFFIPLLQICLIFQISGLFSESIPASSISSFCRRFTVAAVVLITSLFAGAVYYQTAITTAADSFTVRTAKLAASNVIPVLGGVLSESLKTALGGAQIVKSTFGLFGIGVLIYMTLPALAALLVTKLLFKGSSLLACLTGQTKTETFLEEAEGLLGMGIAFVALTALLFIFTVTVLIKSQGVM
ncbi:MAG: hypothetical protein IKD06_05505 [Clostridia bacterium]|nr:hypothetical protein [Clostridia bacterium]